MPRDHTRRDPLRPTDELASLISHQHHEIRSIVHDLRAVHGREREVLFDRLRQFLSAHEAAEQEFIHSRTSGLDGDPGIADARVTEEESIARIVTLLEACPVDSCRFDALSADLSDLTTVHFEAEERRELPAALRSADPPRVAAALAALQLVATLSAAPIGDRCYADWADLASERLLVTANSSAQRGRDHTQEG